MSCPDFACMGFQKCGTTTLFEILRQHPDVVLCADVKEPMYYRIPGIIQFLGRNHRFYRRRYFGSVSADDMRLKGEVNAGLTYTNCAKKVHKNMDPNLKMIFMMRDPVGRSYSAYKYFLARGFLPMKAVRYDMEHGHAEGFDHYVHELLDSPKTRGNIMRKRFKYLTLSQSNYAECIRDYLQYFPRDNMKFIIFEEFVSDQHAACREIYDFLGLDDSDEINYNVRANEGNECTTGAFRTKKLLVMKFLYYMFYEFFNMKKWAPKLYARFYAGYERVRDKAMRLDEDKSAVKPETRAYLMEYFEPGLEELSEIIGRDVREIWRKDADPMKRAA